MATTSDQQQTSQQLADDSKLFGALCYIIGIIIPLFVLFTDKKNDKFVLFHAYQSLLLSGVAFVLSIGLSVLAIITAFLEAVSCIFGIISTLMVLGLFFVVLFAAYKAWTGEKYKLPIIGEYAEKYAAK
jgi:uncharacterized membrane protein